MNCVVLKNSRKIRLIPCGDTYDRHAGFVCGWYIFAIHDGAVCLHQYPCCLFNRILLLPRNHATVFEARQHPGKITFIFALSGRNIYFYKYQSTRPPKSRTHSIGWETNSARKIRNGLLKRFNYYRRICNCSMISKIVPKYGMFYVSHYCINSLCYNILHPYLYRYMVID